jgi:glycerol-3-phosphate acyltransferase PlsX
MRIALDAMGGDYGTGPNLEGTQAALRADPNLEVVLVGDPAELEQGLATLDIDRARVRIVASEGVAGMDEKPVEALMKKPNCSIAVCWKLMAAKDVDAVVSAGSTGAVVGAGLRTKLFLKGVKRPGIAVVLPTLGGPCVLLDVGANPDARADHLQQYAVMGGIYARHVLEIESPSVGLMNIGSEAGKGNEVVKETHNLLSKGTFRDRYFGNVEGRDLYQGQTDVVVCEGFVGNVVLKASEGMVEMMMRKVSHHVISALDQEKHLAKQALSDVHKQFSYHESGGAPLLGVDGICIICHGSSNGRAIENALRVATRTKASGLNERIVEELAALPV